MKEKKIERDQSRRNYGTKKLKSSDSEKLARSRRSLVPLKNGATLFRRRGKASNKINFAYDGLSKLCPFFNESFCSSMSKQGLLYALGTIRQ